MGYLLFCGRTRKMTQYADTAVSDIDPDGARNFSNWSLCNSMFCFYALIYPCARVIERSSCGSNPLVTGNQRKEKIQLPKWVTEFLWLRRWDLNLMTFGLWARRATRLLHSAILWCRKPGSNRYEKKSHGILSPGRLPIPPFRHATTVGGLPRCLIIIAPG